MTRGYILMNNPGLFIDIYVKKKPAKQTSFYHTLWAIPDGGLNKFLFELMM